LRLLLDLISGGIQDKSAIGQKMGAKAKYAARHADYYREAAEILGLLERRRWSLTARGLGLLATKPQSDEERDLLRAAVADASELGDVRKALLSDAQPNVDELVAYAIPRAALGSRHTVERRVKDTLSWRPRLGFAASTQQRRRSADHVGSTADQQDTPFEEPRLEPSDWPDHKLVPFNWGKNQMSVERVVFEDLYSSGQVLLVMGYASLEELCNFVRNAQPHSRSQLRVVFGTEPFRGRDVDNALVDDDLGSDVRDYWLDRGISILAAVSVLETVRALDNGIVETRISRRSQGLHAKMFLAEEAATIGSSNFTGPGLRTQLEANVRLFKGDTPHAYFSEAHRLGEIYWRLSRPFNQQLHDLLETLLQKVTWQEALARGCAELLEGQWARAYLEDELGYSEYLWPSQVQGIGQALYVLMEVGSVLIADATGSGKTKMGAWLLRALRQRLVTQGRPISDPVVVSPPAISDRWSDELHKAEIRIEVHSHGALSSGRAATHARVANNVEVARILVLDEAHNFINASNRTAKVNTNFADHVVLFTATPISRDLSDLLGIAELLGADNLDDETLRILEDAGARGHLLTDDERSRLRHVVKRFTVRRTKSAFNALIDRDPNRYRNEQGDHCRYPKHKAYRYELDESAEDRRLAEEITELARSLRGIVMLRQPLELSDLDRQQGRTPDIYLRMRLASARALARYQLRAALRSSRAALFEHIQGTEAAMRKFNIRRFEKSDSGNILDKVLAAKKSGPPRIDIPEQIVPDWLRHRGAFVRACDEESELYREIAQRCGQLSDGRERAKVRQIKRLLTVHRLLVAFDSRPITLFVLSDILGKIKSTKVFVATGAQPTEQRRVLKAFAPASRMRGALALCSNAMSEGINLQRASAVLHLDMPSVVRIAEQRVGRIDRMDSPHGDVESWWPRDAREFALTADEKLGARLELVGDVLGSNLTLPTDDAEPPIVEPEEIEAEMEAQEQQQVELLDDAFAPVRKLVEGRDALIEPTVYARLRGSTAKVVSAVAAVRATTAWVFVTLPGTTRVAPRWLFVDGQDGPIMTALDDVTKHLRDRLQGVENIELDQQVVDTMRTLLERAEASAVSFLPRRKQRAFDQMRQVLFCYRDQLKLRPNRYRAQLVEGLLRPLESREIIDLDLLLDSWLALIRPRWREALQAGKGPRRIRRLRRLQGLIPELKDNPLADEDLATLFRSVQAAKPLAERVVAAIVGVPA